MAIIVWFAYTMWRSYTAIERELREIRLKCVNAGGAAPRSLKSFTSEPASAMKSDVVSILSRLAAFSKPT